MKPIHVSFRFGPALAAFALLAGLGAGQIARAQGKGIDEPFREGYRKSLAGKAKVHGIGGRVLSPRYFFAGAGSRSGGRAAGSATTMNAKRQNTPIACAQAASAIVVKPIPATRQATASLSRRPGASAASRERA